MKVISRIDAPKLAMGLQQILLDMDAKAKEKGVEFLGYPVDVFERMIMEDKQVSKDDAERVTEKVLNTGIIRWDLTRNTFVL